MSDDNNKCIIVTSVQSRYIQLDEDIFDALSANAYRVYTSLRFYSDFKSNESEVKLTIKSLIEKSKLSESSVGRALNELEYQHFLIQRTNYIHFKYGKVNSFNVSRTYKYFKQIDNTFTTPVSKTVVYNPVTPPSEMMVPTVTNEVPKISLSSSDNIYIGEKDSFDCFFSLYPIKKSENRALAAWHSQSCHAIAEEIILKLQDQIEKDSCFLDGYAPNPDKYIMEERWKDEIQIRKPIKKNLTTSNKRSTGLTDDLSWGGA